MQSKVAGLVLIDRPYVPLWAGWLVGECAVDLLVLGVVDVELECCLAVVDGCVGSTSDLS